MTTLRRFSMGKTRKRQAVTPGPSQRKEPDQLLRGIIWSCRMGRFSVHPPEGQRASQAGLRACQPGLRANQPGLRASQPASLWLALRPGWQALKPAWLALGPSVGMDVWMYGQMYGQKVSPFYRTLSPILGLLPKKAMGRNWGRQAVTIPWTTCWPFLKGRAWGG